jgi:Fe-S cluster assembly protein SufB
MTTTPTSLPSSLPTTGTPASTSNVPEATQREIDDLGRYAFGWADSDVAGATAKRGLSDQVVADISARKNEPEWMLKLRQKSLRLFGKKPMPSWGSDLTGIDFDNIKYFVKSTEKQATTWDDLPADIKNTYDKLGIPEAEKQRLVGGVAAQYESEVVYHQIREDLEEKGVIFVDTDTGLREHEDLFREYFGSVIPPATTSSPRSTPPSGRVARSSTCRRACTSTSRCRPTSGSTPRTWASSSGTLIIVDEGSYVHYVEGCTAPIYKSDSLHSRWSRSS